MTGLLATPHRLDKQQDRSLEYYVRTERPRLWPSRFESLMSTVAVEVKLMWCGGDDAG
jgi:hypothetical protein